MKIKGFVRILSILVAMLLLLCSCAAKNLRVDSTSTDSKNESTNSTTVPKSVMPSTSTPQPIQFTSYSGVYHFLNDKNIDAYARTEEMRLELEKLIDAFEDDGYFNEIKYDGNAKIQNIVLYPKAELEDIGVQCWIILGDEEYQCIVCNTRNGKRMSNNTEEALYEYLLERFKINITHETNDNLSYIYSTFGAKDDPSRKNVIYNPIDECHYLIVRSTCTVEKILDVISKISYEHRAIGE